MPTLIYFVTENFLKANTPISANVSMNEILPLIKNAADSWVRSALGTYFYEDLLTKYNAQTLSVDETTLTSYMQPSIAWRACADSVFELSYQLKNKGIQVQNSDFSSNPDFKAIGFMNQHYTQKAEFYQSRLVVYLKANKALFSVFLDKLNDDSYVKDIDCNNNGDSTGFNSPIFLI